MTIQVRRMTRDDVALGMRLKDAAGWNQTEADWHRVLDLDPDGCFVAEWDGRPVGTTAAAVFGPVAWIAMVLVDPAARRQGVGTALMHRVLAYVDGVGVRTVRLQATPMGQPLYEKLGFVREYELSRYVGTLPSGDPVERVEAARREDFDAIALLDQLATGTDRRKLLARLREEEPGAWRVARRAGQIVGFGSIRRRARAIQLGPLVGPTDIGPLLLADACSRHGGASVFVDVPVDNAAATAGVGRLGLTVERPLLRMSRGPLIEDNKHLLWACFGPEKG